MKRFLLPLTLLIALLWAIDQPAEVLGFSAPFFQMRKSFTVLTGALAFGWMAWTMLLALRPAWLERRLGGLDKLFREHKWAGIGSVLLVVVHWLLVLSPRTLVEWGWVAAPTGGRRPHGAADPLIGLARDSGEWAAWLMIALGIVALLRFVPYSWFRKLHKGFPVTFLIGAFHSVMLMPGTLLTSPLNALVWVLAVGGSVIALMSLAKMIGRNRRTAGRVISVATGENGVVDLRVQPDDGWPGHKAGQFVLLTLDSQEGPHPFSIASDWQPGTALRFNIKPLGDYTRTLAGRIQPGQAALIEGPYGCFDFADGRDERQVWVAGGIGVAPFLARLEELAAKGGASGSIDMFYCVANEADAHFPAGLEDLCWRAGVTLHMRIDSRDGLIGSDEIGAFAKHAGSVWFCGPRAWGKSLRKALQGRYGVAPQHFHQEAFQFR